MDSPPSDVVLWIRVTRVRGRCFRAWGWHHGLLGLLCGCSSIVEPIVASKAQGDETRGSGLSSTSSAAGGDPASSSDTGEVGRTTGSTAPGSGGSDSTGGPPPAACVIEADLSWSSGGVVIEPKPVADRVIGGLKDPSVVYFDGQWHVFATALPAEDGALGMVYLGFEDWADANDLEPTLLDQVPGLEGYHAAPQVFYFAPQDTWYLIYQSQDPQYSTTQTLDDPLSWTTPAGFFPERPASVPSWADFWIICDTDDCFLFFTDHAGALYQSETPVSEFPMGMSDPTVVIQEPDAFGLFEGAAVYKIEGKDQYLAIVEALGGVNQQYYKAYVAPRLRGPWSPLRTTWEAPFAGSTNVTFDAPAWTGDIGHGELLRNGYDQSMVLQPCHMALLHQGRRLSDGAYGLGLLRQVVVEP